MDIIKVIFGLLFWRRSDIERITIGTSLAFFALFFYIWQETGEYIFAVVSYSSLIYLSLVLALPIIYSYLPNGPRMLRATLIAAIPANLVGAVLYATCEPVVTTDCHIPENAAQAWEKLGRYIVFATAVSVSVALILAALDARRLPEPMEWPVVGFAIFFSIIFATLMIFLSGQIIERLPISGGSVIYKDVRPSIDVLIPGLIFIAGFVFIYLTKLSNDSLRWLAVALQIAGSIGILMVAVVPLLYFGTGDKFFFAEGDSTGIGQLVMIVLFPVSVGYILVLPLRSRNTA